MSAVRPQPPPKPLGFPSYASSFPLKTADIAPTDSDTDSGICADSDQSSPRQPSPRGNVQPTTTTRRDGGDYLTPNSARRLLEQQPRRTLPARPSANNTLRKAQFRVRFADEVDSSGASTSSASESPRVETTFSSKPLSLINNNAYAHIEQRRYDSLPRVPRSSRPGFSVDDVESLPEPPSYALAVQRLRTMPQRESVRDTVIRQNVENTMRNRSSSLPRGSRGADLASFYANSSSFGGEQLMGSVDNLHYGTYDDSSLRRRRLPPSPLHRPDIEMIEREPVRQPALMRQRRCRAPQQALARRSASVGRYPDAYMDSMEFGFQSEEPAVRAQLVALDQRGFRTVLVEKTQPGPFGFYIATGVMHGQRGIFISRVSLPSLTPMLSVGDEILYVDDELVKGRSLEYVQSLISGKTAVAIVLLPTVGALC